MFVDPNIPMYLVGASHPYKQLAETVLRGLLSGGRSRVTHAEVLREILHHYSAIWRCDAIGPAFRLLEQVVDICWSISLDHVSRAKTLLESHRGPTARDAAHLVVMEANDVLEILTKRRQRAATPPKSTPVATTRPAATIATGAWTLLQGARRSRRRLRE